VTIAGGKLTTWRTMAIAAVDAAVRHLGAGGPSPRALVEEGLPGGDLERPGLEHVLANELARHADDVIFRRLPIGHDPDQARRALPDVVAAMGSNAGWSASRRQAEEDRVTSRLERDAARLDEALGRS
jgi:glycerol-3-phosphate dehydrogenase